MFTYVIKLPDGNTIKATAIDYVIHEKDFAYSLEQWHYQLAFYAKIGAGITVIYGTGE